MLPASAGMILMDLTPSKRPLCAPRIRGDDPYSMLADKLTMLCSPHPRG